MVLVMWNVVPKWMVDSIGHVECCCRVVGIWHWPCGTRLDIHVAMYVRKHLHQYLVSLTCFTFVSHDINPLR